MKLLFAVVSPSPMTQGRRSHTAHGPHATNRLAPRSAVTHLSPHDPRNPVSPKCPTPLCHPCPPRAHTAQPVWKSQVLNDMFNSCWIIQPHISAAKNKSKQGRDAIHKHILKSKLCSVAWGQGTGCCQQSPSGKPSPSPQNTAPAESQTAKGLALIWRIVSQKKP